MIKYKLLKDLPLAKAGEIVFLNENINMIYQTGDDDCVIPIAHIKMDKQNEWLEEIRELKSVWDLKEWDEHYCIDSQGFIDVGEWKDNLWNISKRKNGNVFLTISEAERECDRRNAIGKIQQYCYENNIDTNWKKDKANFIFMFDTRNNQISRDWCEFIKQVSPLGYFSHDDSEKILKTFPYELVLIYS